MVHSAGRPGPIRGLVIAWCLFSAGCGGGAYDSVSMPPLTPFSTELRARYCDQVRQEELDHAEADRSASNWLLALGGTATTASIATLVAGSQVDGEHRKQTTMTVGTSLLVAGLASLTAGVLLRANHHEERARRAARAVTRLVALGEGTPRDDIEKAERAARSQTRFEDCLRYGKRWRVADDEAAETQREDDAAKQAADADQKVAARVKKAKDDAAKDDAAKDDAAKSDGSQANAGNAPPSDGAKAGVENGAKPKPGGTRVTPTTVSPAGKAGEPAPEGK